MGIFALVFTALIGRMGYLQIVQGDWLAEKGFRNRMRLTPIQPERGDILASSGQPLLKNVVCESVFAQPIVLKDKPAAAAALAPILKLDAAELEKRMNKNSYFEWLKRKVPPAVADQVKALGIDGIKLAPEKCRAYPEDELAVHVLGISNLDHHGIEGLELVYDKHLNGDPGAIQCEYTARGLPIPGGDCRVMEGRQGLSLLTTIDIGMQRLADKVTERAHLETRAQKTTVIVMEVKTGGILAQSQWPRYDPKLGGNSDPGLRRIYTVTDAWSPGSIFKPVTASAALDSGVIDQNSRIHDTGCTQIGGWSVCNWDHKGLGSVGIDVVMAKSSNVGFAQLGMMLGTNRFYDYLERFGLTRQTGVDLPGEAVGQWIPKRSATELDLAIQGFGQTLTVTPIQMLTAISAIANDGKLMKPHLGRALIDDQGQIVKEFEPVVVRQVIKPEVARYVQELMVGVVDTGTGRNARVPGYQVGGKTGTATKVKDGKVAKGSYIASFVGFAPYPNPEVAILISVDEPVGAYYGGQIAAPIFGEVMAEVLAYLDTPPSKVEPPPPQPGFPPAPRPPQEAKVPSVVNLPIDMALKTAKEAGFRLVVEGDGPFVTAQFPLAGTTAYKSGEIKARSFLPPLGADYVHVPALTGKSLADAAQQLAVKGLFLQAEGRGQAVSQQPVAGALVPRGTPIAVKFAPPPKKP